MKTVPLKGILAAQSPSLLSACFLTAMFAHAPYFPGPRTIEETYHRPELWVKINRSPLDAGCLSIAAQ